MSMPMFSVPPTSEMLASCKKSSTSPHTRIRRHQYFTQVFGFGMKNSYSAFLFTDLSKKIVTVYKQAFLSIPATGLCLARPFGLVLLAHNLNSYDSRIRNSCRQQLFSGLLNATFAFEKCLFKIDELCPRAGRRCFVNHVDSRLNHLTSKVGFAFQGE